MDYQPTFEHFKIVDIINDDDDKEFAITITGWQNGYNAIDIRYVTDANYPSINDDIYRLITENLSPEDRNFGMEVDDSIHWQRLKPVLK